MSFVNLLCFAMHRDSDTEHIGVHAVRIILPKNIPFSTYIDSLSHKASLTTSLLPPLTPCVSCPRKRPMPDLHTQTLPSLDAAEDHAKAQQYLMPTNRETGHWKGRVVSGVG
jgi:hypothetical protein